MILSALLAVQRGSMKCLRSAALWIVWNIPVGSFAPHLMAFALRSKGYKRVSKP